MVAERISELRGRRLLIVEDDEDQLKMLAKLLRRHFAEVDQGRRPALRPDAHRRAERRVRQGGRARVDGHDVAYRAKLRDVIRAVLPFPAGLVALVLGCSRPAPPAEPPPRSGDPRAEESAPRRDEREDAPGPVVAPPPGYGHKIVRRRGDAPPAAATPP